MKATVIESKLEGILFASGEPVPIPRLCKALDVSSTALSELADRLAADYQNGNRGIRLLRLDDSYQLCSAPEHGDLIRRVLETRRPPQLSPAALEVLSIVAYFQPVTKGYIEQMRGIDSAYTVTLLEERGLIACCGKLAVPGRPAIFRTTELFLRCFGLTSLDDLPPLPENGDEGALAEELQRLKEEAETP